MRTKKNKEEFVKEMNNRIETRNIILDFYNNVFLPLICLKYDGKVYNNRLINELNKEAKKISPLLYVKREYTWGELSINMRQNNYNYNDYEQLYFKLNINSESRIDYDATMKIDINQKWLQSFIKYKDEYKKTIDNYDMYMSIAEQLENALKTYNNIPHSFRDHLDTTYMHIY